MKATRWGNDNLSYERFICSQTLMMSFIGIPAFYIHSILGTENYYKGVEETGMPRSINRRKWFTREIYPELEKESTHARVLKELRKRILIRKKIAAFHPDETQRVVKAGKKLFVLKRGKDEEILVLANISPDIISLNRNRKYLNAYSYDLLTNKEMNSGSIDLNPYQVLWLRK
jgi:sucrose phosphorylase